MNENRIDIMLEAQIKYTEKLWKEKEELQQENKQLKEQLEYLKSNEYLNQVKWERNLNEELVKDLQQRIDKAIENLFNLKDMVYKPETREINFDIQREISTIIKILGAKENE